MLILGEGLASFIFFYSKNSQRKFEFTVPKLVVIVNVVFILTFPASSNDRATVM